jgi:hypothetical protein
MSRSRIAIAVMVVACGGFATAATAVAPVKGGKYKGRLAAPKRDIRISWTVTSDRARVAKLATTDTPIYCDAVGDPIPLRFQPIQITESGTFTASMARLITEGANKGKPQVTVTITGTFAKRRRATGTFKADWFGDSTDCDGKSAFTAKVP